MRECCWLEWGSLQCCKKGISNHPHGRIRSSDKVYLDGNRRQPLGSECFISVRGEKKKSKLYFIKPSTKDKGQIFCAFCSVQFSPGPHLVSLVCVPSWIPAGVALLYSGLCLEPGPQLLDPDGHCLEKTWKQTWLRTRYKWEGTRELLC